MSAAKAVGFVVAGGRSRRMGRDKALLGWGGATLLDQAIAKLAAVCDDVRVLSGLQRRYTDRGRAVVVDAAPEAGPLAGLAAALAAAAPRPALLLAVDMPFVTPELLQHLVEGLDGWDAAVPVPEGRPEPLCAAYAPACLAPVQASLAAGERKMTSFWEGLRVRAFSTEDLSRFGAPDRLLRNLNDPSDYAAAVERRSP
ncbi:MAG TPA: molybdenum cofactor guanylyltransferase [Vicinamibacteria bacterium]|nr:molybdenum cofactor guanylyltransferase [Vicinamibacteria bacterium]